MYHACWQCPGAMCKRFHIISSQFGFHTHNHCYIFKCLIETRHRIVLFVAVVGAAKVLYPRTTWNRIQWRSPSYETTAQLNIPSDKSYVHFLSHIRNSLKLAICFQWYFREICKSIDSAKPYNGSCECFCAVFILPDNLGHRHCWHTPADPPRGSNAHV